MNQREMIIQYMRDYGSITTFDAFIDLGIARLGARISELRKLGYDITSTPVSKNNRYGKKIYFNRYFLADKKRA